MTGRRSGPEMEASPLLLRVIEDARAEARALPPAWSGSGSDLGRFSRDKSLYGYQRHAVDNALWGLWLYYDKCGDYRPEESESDRAMRKRRFSLMLHEHSVKCGEARLSPENYMHGSEWTDAGVYAALAERIRPEGGMIPFRALCNRMGFWMATGSGKTLVMVKLMENLRRLMDAGEIPRRKILVLAPGALLLDQIHEAVGEYNRANRRPMDLVSLRRWNSLTGRGRDAVFYYDAANISDERKQVRVDWRDFDSGGEWYVLLDEAHRGAKADSKRQAYYALLAREGFLFNFSATFAEPMDVCMTGARFNLGNFISEGYGKHICLCGADFRDFARRGRPATDKEKNAFCREDYGDAEKRGALLKSALALALAKGEIGRLRARAEAAGVSPPYHEPLMVTMTNSVNTPQSDLAVYVNVLKGLASPEGIDADEFARAREEFAEDLRGGDFQFEGARPGLLRILAERAGEISAAEVRQAVFLTGSPGALEIVKGESGKELAVKMRTAAEPFGLIRIGDTANWIRQAEQAGIVVGDRVRAESYFKGLEKSRISALMGSRAFVESWDSIRPNVLSFVNIGVAREAVKFIVQSIGRGVRIQPLPERRRRQATLGEELTESERSVFSEEPATAAAETLFVFAAQRKAVLGALEGLAREDSGDGWSRVENVFRLNPRPLLLGGGEMPLLVPKYRRAELPREQWREFRVTEEAEGRILDFVKPMPDCVLAVAHEKGAGEILDFRAMMSGGNFWSVSAQGEKFHSPESAIRGVFEHLRVRAEGKKAEGVRPLRESGIETDIVHFKRVEIRGSKEEKNLLRGKISGGTEEEERITRAEDDFRAGKITREEFRRIRGEAPDGWEKKFPELVVRKLAEHYYAPLVAANDEARANYIRRIVKVKSEAEFLADLEGGMDAIAGGWDAWMFSKLDADTDRVSIPYRDGGALRQFHPDFVFWMCRGDEYRIVFVDPKGMAHADSFRKLDGYAELFKDGAKLREFRREGWRKVTVALLFYNTEAGKAPREYRSYWTEDPSDIFAG